MDALVARSAAARESIAGWPEDEVDDLITALAEQIAGHADELAAATVAETGIGCVPDKADKNRFASLGVARSLVGKPGVGVIGRREREALTEIADPMGVVLGLIPMTNPVSTLVFKALICIKARDALIVSCHRDAANVGAGTTACSARSCGGTGHRPIWFRSVPWRPTRATTAALMRHPGVSMILATGGTAMVKAAYSSGTPAIGVGARERAGLGLRRRRRWGSCPDGGGQQGIRSRHHLRLGEQPGRRPVGAGLLRRRAAQRRRGRARPRRMRPPGAVRLRRHGTGACEATVLGQAATFIAAQAGIAVPAGTRLLVAPVPRQAVSGPYGREKLAPILSLFTADGEDDGIRLCLQILGHGGRGHTAIIHTRSQRLQLSFAQQMPVSRVLVNGPGAQGCIGLGNGLTPSLTLGCGTYGRTSTTDNVTYTNLVNIKRMAHPLAGAGVLPPPDPEGGN